MTKTVDAVTGFFNEQDIKLTIVEMEKDKDVFTISFDAPEIKSLRELSAFIRKEQTDSFLLSNIREHNGSYTATVIAKKLLDKIANLSSRIGNEFDNLVQEYSPVLLEEDTVAILEEGMTEMFELATSSEELAFQIIAPKQDTLLQVTEFNEATSHLFTIYKGILSKQAKHCYKELIHLTDRIEG